MSDIVTLTARATVTGRLDTEGITADRIAQLSQHEIASLPVWLGRTRAQLGDFFDVRGERAPRVRIEGATRNLDGIAAGMTAGELILEGDAGHRLGEGMSGGSIEVRGSVGDEAGAGMSGGLLRVAGDAGDRLGAARAGASKGITGGEIVVTGAAGQQAAARARRGLVVVGRAGDYAARNTIAGTLVVLGSLGEAPGIGSKRGSIVALGPVNVPATYEYACTFEPPFVRLLLAYLVRRHGLPIEAEAITARYSRYCGDAGLPGKGEILIRE